MKRLALCIVRSGNPIKRPPEGRSLRDAPSVNGTQKQNAFSGASALFHVSSALFFHIFSRKRGWNQIATQRSGCNLERTSSEMYEFCRLRRNEEYGACEDEPAERRPLCRKPHRASGAYGNPAPSALKTFRSLPGDRNFPAILILPAGGQMDKVALAVEFLDHILPRRQRTPRLDA